MSRIISVLLTRTLCVALALVASVSAAHGQTDPREIMNRVQDLYRGESSHGVATMEVVTEHWSREITMELWTLGEDYSLVRIRAPAKEAGTATLMADDDIWNYLPKVDRTIKVPASMMWRLLDGVAFHERRPLTRESVGRRLRRRADVRG